MAGIFHLAGVLDDGIVANMTEGRIRAVVAPKAAGLALVALARARRWGTAFVCLFSSTTSALGYAGQFNYGAANALLDAAATNSSGGNECGPRVITINWGTWAEVGMASRDTAAFDAAVRGGSSFDGQARSGRAASPPSWCFVAMNGQCVCVCE